MKSELFAAAIVAMLVASPAMAGQEPYGEAFDGWSLTQTDEGRLIKCRAHHGASLMAMRTDGEVYVSVSANGLPKFYDEEGNISIGGHDSLTQVKSEGQGGRLLIGINGSMDRTDLERIAKAQGYSWRGGPRGGKTYSGTVKFNGSALQAYDRLIECVKANGGK